jgi:hypothetical protein
MATMEMRCFTLQPTLPPVCAIPATGSRPESARPHHGPAWLIKVKGSWLQDKMALYLAKLLLLDKGALWLKALQNDAGKSSSAINPNWTGDG